MQNQIYNPPLPKLFIYALIWLVAVYALNCVIARKFIKPDTKQLLLHVSAVAMIGPLGEIFVASLYRAIVGQPFWHYTVYPVQHAYTSKFAVFLWGIYGLHLYLLHGTINNSKKYKTFQLALLFSLEAVMIEALVNITYKLSFNHLIYYYFPSDLWHYTSLRTIPFYLFGGLVIVKSFKKFEAQPIFFTGMCAAIVITVVFLA